MQSSFARGRWVWWVDELYHAVPNLNSYFDGVSVHPYGHDIRHRSPAITGKAYYGYQQMRRIELIRNQFIHHRAGNKPRSEEHTSELQSRQYLVCRLLLEKTKKNRARARPVARDCCGLLRRLPRF